MADRSRLRALLSLDLNKLVARFPGPIPDLIEMEKSVFAMRHGQAIQMLVEAEQFLCRDRVACLFEVVPDLEPEALPEWFFLRLSRLESRLRTKGNRGPRNPERDDEIRFRFIKLRNALFSGLDAPLTYEQALKEVGHEFALDAKSVEKIIGKEVAYNQIRDRDLEADLRRLQDYMSQWPSPKND